MKTFFMQLEAEMNDKLNTIQYQFDADIEKSFTAINYIGEVIANIKKVISPNKFKDKKEEIDYLKYILPGFISNLIYFQEIYDIQVYFPVGSYQARSKYLQERIQSIDEFYECNKEFYKYMRTQSTALDTAYFTFGKRKPPLNFNTAVKFDDKICTPASYLVAKMKSNELLCAYCEQLLQDLEIKRSNNNRIPRFNVKLQWTAAQVSLVELMYALQASGSINNGKMTIKGLSTILETVFNVRIANVYKSFEEISLRKKNTTVFMDFLKESLLREIDKRI